MRNSLSSDSRITIRRRSSWTPPWLALSRFSVGNTIGPKTTVSQQQPKFSLTTRTGDLPVLLKHFDDKRYSRTYCTSSDSGADNLNVGSVCEEIVAESLSQAFYEYIPEGDKVAYQLRLADRGASNDLKTWCMERRDKPFYELQIEQCELAIDRIKHLRGHRKITSVFDTWIIPGGLCS